MTIAKLGEIVHPPPAANGSRPRSLAPYGFNTLAKLRADVIAARSALRRPTCSSRALKSPECERDGQDRSTLTPRRERGRLGEDRRAGADSGDEADRQMESPRR